MRQEVELTTSTRIQRKDRLDRVPLELGLVGEGTLVRRNEYKIQVERYMKEKKKEKEMLKMGQE